MTADIDEYCVAMLNVPDDCEQYSRTSRSNPNEKQMKAIPKIHKIINLDGRYVPRRRRDEPENVQ